MQYIAGIATILYRESFEQLQELRPTVKTECGTAILSDYYQMRLGEANSSRQLVHLWVYCHVTLNELTENYNGTMFISWGGHYLRKGGTDLEIDLGHNFMTLCVIAPSDIANVESI